MKKYNGCIYLLSSRKQILKKCLLLLDENYNHKYKYPVYVYYFDDIYSKNFIEDIKKSLSSEVYFINIPYQVPSHIKEKELFYNRDNEYARNFTKERMGYLHMENFVCNIQALNEIKKYDYYHRIDDDSWFKKPFSLNLFEEMDNGNYPMATSQLWTNLSQRVYDVRENLFKFTKEYCIRNNITPKSNQLQEAFNSNNEKKFHLLSWTSGNCNLYNMKFFRTTEWNNWIGAVNKYGGCYKYRWGDQEIIGLFAYIFFDNPVLDFELVEKGVYSPKLPETLMAPTTKKDSGNLRERFYFLLKKIKNKINFFKK